MDGRIISVDEVEDKEGYRHREILIKIPEPSMPNQPMGWVPDWREIQEQQSPFSIGLVKDFEQYEEAIRMYDVFCDKLDAFHIGGVAITQADVKE